MSARKVVVVNERPNHLLHLILTLLTSGFWLPIWFLVTIKCKLRRMGID